MNERNPDDYYVCEKCGELIMIEDMNEEGTCTKCGSSELDYFEG